MSNGLHENPSVGWNPIESIGIQWGQFVFIGITGSLVVNLNPDKYGI